MALVTGPLLSLGASGQVAGAMVFATWKGRPYVRQLVKPSNPNTVGQIATRAMFRFLAQNWANLSGGDQATWEDLAKAKTVSPFNAYVSWNMDLWTQFEFPMDTPTSAAGTVPVMGTLTLTGATRQFQFSQVITTPNDISGIVLVISDSTIVTPVKTQVIRLEDYVSSPVEGIITPLDPGTYHVRSAGFTTGGNLSAYTADQTVTVL